MRSQAHPSVPQPSTNTTNPKGARQTVFDRPRDFTITGGTFIGPVSVSNSGESDFSNISVGHLKLLKEVAKQNIVQYRDVYHKRTGVVKRRVPEVVGVRRIHRARIHGSREEFTAVVYDQGSDFEKHRAHAERREEFRHPSLVQLFGVTSGSRLKALIYNDGLMPLDSLRQLHQKSVLVSGCLESELGRHLLAALYYWMDVTGEWLVVPDSFGFRTQLGVGTVLWICISTGQLCIVVNDDNGQDLTPLPLGLQADSIPLGVHLTSEINLEEKILSKMSLHAIHNMSFSSGQWRRIETYDPGTVLFGSLSAHLFDPFSEVSVSHNLGYRDVCMGRWEYTDSYNQHGSLFSDEGFVTVKNGWTRVALPDLPINEECHFRKRISLTWEADREIEKIWLSQANHVIEKSGLDAGEYFIVHRVILQFSISSNVDEFTLQGTFMADTPRDDIYLFLLPTTIYDSECGDLGVPLPPESKTCYWSSDPAGDERLPQHALEKFSLPQVKFRVLVYGAQWSQELYDSIAEFHRAKEFEPNSQDVANELGYPLVDVDKLKNLIRQCA